MAALFRDVVPILGTISIVAVEQDRGITGPNRLQRLDLFHRQRQGAATLRATKAASCLPSGKTVAYFIDKEILEIRDLASPNRAARLRIGLASFAGRSTNRVSSLSVSSEKSGDLAGSISRLARFPRSRIPVAQPTPGPHPHGLTFRDFAISPMAAPSPSHPPANAASRLPLPADSFFLSSPRTSVSSAPLRYPFRFSAK